jgi:hypothetical protein
MNIHETTRCHIPEDSSLPSQFLEIFISHRTLCVRSFCKTQKLIVNLTLDFYESAALKFRLDSLAECIFDERPPPLGFWSVEAAPCAVSRDQ